MGRRSSIRWGIGDISTGVHGLSAVLAALLYRERSGKGQWVDVSLVDTYSITTT
jgi:crotonobetainyl-CoA:carnitine CoA-transferase CaiB-like acyl-CoA transferase